MDIFGILDPDPHENLCGSETLLFTNVIMTIFFTNQCQVLIPVIKLDPVKYVRYGQILIRNNTIKYTRKVNALG